MDQRYVECRERSWGIQLLTRNRSNFALQWWCEYLETPPGLVMAGVGENRRERETEGDQGGGGVNV